MPLLLSLSRCHISTSMAGVQPSLVLWRLGDVIIRLAGWQAGGRVDAGLRVLRGRPWLRGACGGDACAPLADVFIRPVLSSCA